MTLLLHIRKCDKGGATWGGSVTAGSHVTVATETLKTFLKVIYYCSSLCGRRRGHSWKKHPSHFKALFANLDYAHIPWAESDY